MNITSKPMNISYISRLTGEVTKEYNSDEYMSLYSLVPRNIQIYSSVTSNCEYSGIYSPVTRNREIYLGPRTPHAPAMCPYIPQLTEEYKAICSLVNGEIY
jgi:hypothetical protein